MALFEYSKIRIGNSQPTKIYLGSSLLYEAVPLTIGQIETSEIIGQDEPDEIDPIIGP